MDFSTSETTSDRRAFLKPFSADSARTKELGKRGGSATSRKKKLAAKLREFRKQYPESEKSIADFFDILCDIESFGAFTESEMFKLLFFKEAALEKATDPASKYRIQRGFIMTVLELGNTFFDRKSEFRQNFLIASSSNSTKVVPWETTPEIESLRQKVEENYQLTQENEKLKKELSSKA